MSCHDHEAIFIRIIYSQASLIDLNGFFSLIGDSVDDANIVEEVAYNFINSSDASTIHIV